VGILAAAVVCAAGLVTVAPGLASAQPPPLGLTKSGPSEVLDGQSARYTLTASNPQTEAGEVTQFNVTFTDALLPGVSYVPGSTTPTDTGDPTIVTDSSGAQTLIWSDVFDLSVGDTESISFAVQPDNAVWPVGSTFSDTATVYSSTDPRTIPKFTATGDPIPDPSVLASTPSTDSTTVTALEVTKAEPSPEAKLLRGVHDHPTVYTVTVTNSGLSSTTGVTATDFLPASLEFLGCGGVDNSTGVEYPGAPRLTATPVVASDCPTPVSVDTVTDPPGQPPGVYTAVTWDVGTLTAGQAVTINYAAGIPLRQNTVTFPGGTPIPGSLDQTANLDNNTGPSTRQDGPAAGLTNSVVATGTFTGAVAPGTSNTVVADGSHTVTANDLRVIKSVTPTGFVSGQLATYSLQISASEYVSSSMITVTDTIPNGVCPLDTLQNYVDGSPADCAPGSVSPSVPYQSVTQNPDGTFTVVFDPIPLPVDGSTTITYQARMRDTYTGGALAGETTVAGDSFTNNASETATTTPRLGTGETGPLPVTDSTSVTQTSTGGSLTKLIQPRTAVQNCSDDTYADSTTLTPLQTAFLAGDRVCFEITAPFAPDNETRNPIIADFLPAGTSYEAGSFVLGPANNVPSAEVHFDATDAAAGNLTWTLGAPQPDGSLIVPLGSVFQARFSVVVTAPAPGPLPDKTGNLVKLHAVNSAGNAQSLRAMAPFLIAAAPPVAITKGVDSINGLPAAGNPPNTDHLQVQEGDSVVFRVDVSNEGSLLNLNAQTVHSVQVWDALPADIRCAQVSNITNGGTCTDPGDVGHPSFAGSATLSAVVWAGTPSDLIPPGTSTTYRYTVTIPPDTSVGQDLVDTASVRSFNVNNNIAGQDTVYFPANNVDTGVDPSAWNAPAASDPSDVFTASAALAKTVVSAINEPGNVGQETPPGTGSTQATIGEQVTYTIYTDVPPDSTVFGGQLTDPLPAGLDFVSATAGFSPSAGIVPPTEPLPPGVIFDTQTGTLTLPAVTDNTTDTAQRYAVTIVAQVNHDVGNVAGVIRANTATFTSTAPPGGTTPPNQTASAQVAIVEPQPVLTKSANPVNVIGGQTVTYTLNAANTAGASVLHDAWVADCVPAGLTFVAYGTPTQGTTVAPLTPGDGTTCPTTTTQLEWNVGDIDPGAGATLTYTVTVDPQAVGQQTYTNQSDLTGNSLAGARTGPADPGNPAGRIYTSPASSTIAVVGANVTKTVTPSFATIGQTVTYTVTAIAVPNVTFLNASVIDTLPNGLDPASVQLGTVTCSRSDGNPCDLTSAGPLAQSPGPGGTTIVGFLVGNVMGEPVTRAITITYSARVADVAAAQAGVILTNSAKVKWDTNPATPPPTSAGATFDQISVATGIAPFTVIEPSMSIVKSVDDTTVEPGQVVHYTVRASNASGPNVSAAYNVPVTDTIPTGIVVDPATISGGGVLTGGNPVTGGGTIAWAVPGPVAPAASLTFTYSAKLAPSPTVTANPLTNTADITGYDSLPTGGRHYAATPPAPATVTPVFPHVMAAKSTPGGTTAYIGESFPWQITLTNGTAGTGTATAFQVGTADNLPPSWTYDPGSARVSVGGGPAQAVEPVVSESGDIQTLTWTNLATLAPGASLTITYTATPTTNVVADPGVGLIVNQTNTAIPNALDATGASGNKSGSYGGPPGPASAHIASADLSLTKTVGTAPIAGQTGTWVLSVANAGPDTATGPFKITDPLDQLGPPGVTAVSATGTGWTCAVGTAVTCTRTNSADTLASGATFPPVTVIYDVSPDVASGAVVTNAATVDARTFDPVPVNNTDIAATTVNTKADLQIVKTLTAPQLVAGQPVTYSMAVTNLGPSISAGPFAVQDVLPTGVTFVSASGDGWVCDPIAPGAVGATLTCTHADPLALGDSASAIALTVGIPSSQTGAVTNTAAISQTTTPDPNLGNNSSTVSATPVLSADLAIQKQHLGPFVAGEAAVYELTVHNNGPSDAASATITDTLPSSLTFDASANAEWTCSAVGQLVTCAHPTPLGAGTTSTVDLNVLVAPSNEAPIENSASVSSPTPDPVTANNADGDNTSVNTSADLAITKSHLGEATAGDPLSYSLIVANIGPSDVAGAVTVSDPLPTGLAYDTANPAGGTGWSCTFNPATTVVTCTLAAGLAATMTAPPITLNVIVDPDAGPSTITNTAVVTSATADPNLSNNASRDPVTVGVDAHVSLTKTLTSPTPLLAGTNATFVLQASNSGPSDASLVTVTDVLPDHLTYVSASGDGWLCPTPLGQNIVCSRASVPADPPGSPVPAITVVARVDPATPFDPPGSTTTLDNDAHESTPTPGTVTNPAPVPVPVVAEADLTLTKTPSTPTADAGGTFSWVLTVVNTGPSDAVAPLTVSDTLPDAETFLSASAPWTCTATGQTVTCTLPTDLDAAQTAVPLTILVQVDATAPVGDQVNTASVTSPTPGTHPSANGTVTIERVAALTITKTHSGNGTVGQDLDFQLVVHNTGPSVADEVVVTDPLPVGLTFVAASGTDWTCSAAGVDVSCDLAVTLDAGGDAPPIVLTVLVGPAAYPTVTNVGTARSTDPDLTGTATDDDSVAIDPAAHLILTKRHNGTFTVGSNSTYAVTVTNTGPTATPGPVEVTDPLPAGLGYVSASGPGWTCSAKGNDVTCVHPGPLAVNAVSPIALTVSVMAAAAPSVVNTASASAPGSPDASGSDTAPVTIPPAAPAAAAASGSAPAATTTGSALPSTGVDILASGLFAVGLLTVGGLVLRASRRRSRR
jgi:uncharacterized repeat protein (TIGR01451 family)/fimbrial isopeptide formation D2 family protein